MNSEETAALSGYKSRKQSGMDKNTMEYDHGGAS
jgi:hypothetical protein